MPWETLYWGTVKAVATYLHAIYKREKTFHKWDTKKHPNKTHIRHNNLIPPSSLQHPPHFFNANHTQPLHQNKICMLLSQPLHSHPKQKSNHSYSNKITIQIWFCMHALMRKFNPYIHDYTPTICVDGGRCDGVILYIGECKYNEVLWSCCNWSVRCVVCVCVW